MHLWSARSLSQLAAGELRTGKPQTLAVFTSGSGQDESTTSTKGQLLPYQSATGRTTMCSVWRHVSTHAAVTESQPVASNKQDPRVPLAPRNWPELLLSICSVNPAQKIPPIWLFPLIQPPFFIPTHPGYTLSPHLPLARSQLGHFTLQKQNKTLFVCIFSVAFLSPRPLCGYSKLRLVYEVCANIVRTPGDNVGAWMRPSCGKFESLQLCLQVCVACL